MAPAAWLSRCRRSSRSPGSREQPGQPLPPRFRGYPALTGPTGGPRVRAALLGYGLGGSAFHAPVLAATPGLEVAAVVTGDPDRAAAARARHPQAAVVGSADELWARADRLDLAVIATPNRTHVPLAMAALEAGLHVVVDKPLAPTAEEARGLVREARRRGRVLTVYHNRRWDADFLTLRRLVSEGALGQVHRLESRFERWRPEPKPGWRQDPDPAEAGGLLFDLGPHLIDQALLLFGPVRHVYAELDSRRPGSRVDDDAFLALTHESGVRSHLWMNVITAGAAPRFRVLGSDATWTKHGTDVQEGKLRAGGAVDEPEFGSEPPDQHGILHDGARASRTPSETGCYTAFYAALVRCLTEGGPPPVDPVDAVAGLEIIEAAHRQTAGPPG